MEKTIKQKKKEIQTKKTIKIIAYTNIIIWLTIISIFIVNKNVHQILNLQTQSLIIGIGVGYATKHLIDKIEQTRKETYIKKRDIKSVRYHEKRKTSNNRRQNNNKN